MTTDTTSPPRFSSKERLILLVLVGAGFMFAIDLTILNIALPVIGKGIKLSLSELPWVISAFALPAAGFTLLFGRLGDTFGRRKLFLSGLVLLIAGSLVGGFANNVATLLTARTLQGFAAALAIPSALSLLTTTFSEGARRDKALALNGTLLISGFTIAALVGGILVNWLTWRAAFFINVPVGVVLIALTPFVLTESSRTARVKLDLPGAVTVTAGLLAVVYAVLQKNIPAAIAGVVLLAAFFVIELRSPAPLAPVRILKRPTVKWGNFAGLATLSMGVGLVFMTTLYLQQVLHFSPLIAGLIFGAPGAAALPAGALSGKLLGRFGFRKVLAVCLTVQGLAPVPIIWLGGYRWAVAILIPALVVTFFAHVINIVGYTVTGTAGLPNHEQGLATGLTSMTQQIAVSIGIPIAGAIAATQTAELTGIHLDVAVAAGVLVVSAVITWFGLRTRGVPAAPPAPATEQASQPLAMSSD